MLTIELLTELHCYATYRDPHEICGLLFEGAGFVACQNTAAHPDREFNLHPDEYRTACERFGTPWALVHSHPGRNAAPSVKDCELMDALQLAKMDLAMVIVGLRPVEVRIFKKHGDLYSLRAAFHQREGKWWGHKMGAVIQIQGMDPATVIHTAESE